jgi:hypothetical protein
MLIKNKNIEMGKMVYETLKTFIEKSDSMKEKDI